MGSAHHPTGALLVGTLAGLALLILKPSLESSQNENGGFLVAIIFTLNPGRHASRVSDLGKRPTEHGNIQSSPR